MKIKITEDLARQAWETTRNKPEQSATWYCAECVLARAIRDQAQLPEPYVVAVTANQAWLYRERPGVVRSRPYYDKVTEIHWSEASYDQVRKLLAWFDGLSRETITTKPEGFFVPPITELDLPELDDLLKGVLPNEDNVADEYGAESVVSHQGAG